MKGGGIHFTFYRVRRELSHPYCLSQGSHRFFAGTICKAQDEDGRTGWGESVVLPGYSWESEDGIWRNLNRFAEDPSSNELFSLIDNPFAWAALLTAVEQLSLPDSQIVEKVLPLVATLSLVKGSRLLGETERLIAQGYRTLKVKVGIAGIREDISSINEMTKKIPSGTLLRIDANQNYSVEEALEFLGSVDPEKIEYLEQPFLRSDWGSLEQVRDLGIPVMLDESIWLEKDLDEAWRRGIKIVKLKLLKHASPSRAAAMIQKASNLGLRIVWGNGFQGEIGCWHEFLLAQQNGLTPPLECNGYLKLRDSILEKDFDMTGPLQVSEKKVEKAALEKTSYRIDRELLARSLPAVEGAVKG